MDGEVFAFGPIFRPWHAPQRSGKHLCSPLINHVRKDAPMGRRLWRGALAKQHCLGCLILAQIDLLRLLGDLNGPDHCGTGC
jgi:hypothetical protein